MNSNLLLWLLGESLSLGLFLLNASITSIQEALGRGFYRNNIGPRLLLFDTNSPKPWSRPRRQRCPSLIYNHGSSNPIFSENLFGNIALFCLSRVLGYGERQEDAQKQECLLMLLLLEY
jgi:hypothetical protein